VLALCYPVTNIRAAGAKELTTMSDDKVPVTEITNQEQGRGVPAQDRKKGPAAGGGGSNPTNNGGINEPTKGKP
jgi:hypothetical protein